MSIPPLTTDTIARAQGTSRLLDRGTTFCAGMWYCEDVKGIGSFLVFLRCLFSFHTLMCVCAAFAIFDITICTLYAVNLEDSDGKDQQSLGPGPVHRNQHKPCG